MPKTITAINAQVEKIVKVVERLMVKELMQVPMSENEGRIGAQAL